MMWFSAVRLVDYAPHYRIGPHAHAEASLSLIIGGRYCETIQGAEADHEAGHMLYCPPGEEHAQTFAGGGACQAQLTPTADCLAYLRDTVDLNAAASSASLRFSVLGRRIGAELQRADAVSGLAVESLALEAMTLFARASTRQDGAPRWLSRVHDYVHAHALEGFVLQDVARAAGCRPEQIGPALSRFSGTSLAGLARRRRLEEAAGMLGRDDASISGVAAACGFSDQAHLTRAFKSTYGLTPGAFRRLKTVAVPRSIPL